jgi:hypothetical protein
MRLPSKEVIEKMRIDIGLSRDSTLPNQAVVVLHDIQATLTLKALEEVEVVVRGEAPYDKP